MAKKYKIHWIVLIYLGVFFLISNLALKARQYQHAATQQLSAAHHVNATLEFGAIYAVSRSGSPRRPGLKRAAALTGLHIEMPDQPDWTDSDLIDIMAQENSTLRRGSALAWLGHLNVLKTFLDSDYETALIVEDDIDFDTHIRNGQIPITANAIHELLGFQNKADSFYGSTSGWDMLWLGHCGDFFDAENAAQILPIKIFTDTTLPPLEDLHPWTKEFLEQLGPGNDQKRLVYKSVNPLCTFAYAVTRRAAEGLVNDFAAREPSRPEDQPCSAFDVRMLEACRDGGYKCITVTPELFHHMATPSEIAISDKDPRAGGHEPEDGHDTPNIRCSARSDLWWDSRSSYYRPQVTAQHKTVSQLAQTPGYCYLDELE